MDTEYRYIALLSFCEYDAFRNCKLRFYDFPDCEVEGYNFLDCIDIAKIELGYFLWKAEREKQELPKATKMRDLDLSKIKANEQISVVVLHIDDFVKFDAQMEHKNFNKELRDKIGNRFKIYLKKLGYTDADEDATRDYYSSCYESYMEGYRVAHDEIVKKLIQANVHLFKIMKVYPGYSLQDLEKIKQNLIDM